MRTEHDKLVEDCARATATKQMRAVLHAAGMEWPEGQDALIAKLIRPAIDLVVEQCALIARDACLVPPDGGSPNEDECRVADEAERRIRALLSPNDRGA